MAVMGAPMGAVMPIMIGRRAMAIMAVFPVIVMGVMGVVRRPVQLMSALSSMALMCAMILMRAVIAMAGVRVMTFAMVVGAAMTPGRTMIVIVVAVLMAREFVGEGRREGIAAAAFQRAVGAVAPVIAMIGMVVTRIVAVAIKTAGKTQLARPQRQEIFQGICDRRGGERVRFLRRSADARAGDGGEEACNDGFAARDAPLVDLARRREIDGAFRGAQARYDMTQSRFGVLGRRLHSHL